MIFLGESVIEVLSQSRDSRSSINHPPLDLGTQAKQGGYLRRIGPHSLCVERWHIVAIRMTLHM